MQLARCRLLVNTHGISWSQISRCPVQLAIPLMLALSIEELQLPGCASFRKGTWHRSHTAPRAQQVQSCSWVLTLLRHLLYLMCCTVAQEVGCVLHKSAVGIGVGLLGMVVAARTQYCRVYEARSVPYTTLTAVSATLLVTLRTGAHHQATSTGLSQAPLVEVLRFHLDEHA